VRVRRLGFFEEGSVNVETPPVPGTSDQVDIDLTVAEKSTGNVLAGVGYSSSDGVVFNASISQQNIFGSGNALALAVNTSKINRTISATFVEPYWTVDGVSRIIEIYDKYTDPTSLSVSQYAASTIGGALTFGIPVSEIDTINAGFRIEHTDLTLFQQSPPIYFEFVRDFGNPTYSYIVSGGWARDTRNDILYPTFGRLQSFLAEVGLPIGDLAYYKLNYVNQAFWPVYGDFVLMLKADLGYGDGYDQKPFPLQGVTAAWVGTRVRGRDTGSARHLRQYAGGKRRSSAMPSELSGDQGREVRASADSSTRPDLRQRQPARLREFPVLHGRRRVVEFTDRAPQDQLRLPAQYDSGRQNPAFPIPGGAVILMAVTGHSRRRPSACRRRLS
jgi:outer membrane protein insertion porin family